MTAGTGHERQEKRVPGGPIRRLVLITLGIVATLATVSVLWGHVFYARSVRWHPLARSPAWYLMDYKFINRAMSAPLPLTVHALRSRLGAPAFIIERELDGRFREVVASESRLGQAQRVARRPPSRQAEEGTRGVTDLRPLSEALGVYANEASVIFPINHRLYIYPGRVSVAFFWADGHGMVRHRWINKA